MEGWGKAVGRCDEADMRGYGDGWRGLDKPVIKYSDSRGVGWRLMDCWGSWLIQTEKRGGGRS